MPSNATCATEQPADRRLGRFELEIDRHDQLGIGLEPAFLHALSIAAPALHRFGIAAAEEQDRLRPSRARWSVARRPPSRLSDPIEQYFWPGICAPHTTKRALVAASRLNASCSIDLAEEDHPAGAAGGHRVDAGRHSWPGAVWLTVKSQSRARAASPMLASSSRKKGCDSGSGRAAHVRRDDRDRSLGADRRRPAYSGGTDIRDRAPAPRCAAWSRVLISGWSLSARDTVEIDTPASFARSCSVVLLLLVRAHCAQA